MAKSSSTSLKRDTWHLPVIENSTSLTDGLGGVSIATIVKVAWAVLIWHYTGSENVSFLSISTADDEQQYYPCTVLVHGDSQISALTMQVMQNVKENTSTETSTDSTPFLPNESPLLNTFTTLKTANCSTPVTESPPDRPVELCITKICNTLEISIYFRPNALSMQFADRLVATFSHVLTTLAGTPKEDTVSSLDLVSKRDKTELWAWNKAQLPETVHDSIHNLFQQQAASQPHAMAVDAFDGCFTYRQLDTAANRLAHELVREGVGRDSMVPLCFEKSCWAIVALMGVLKAGGALVFIDPANPESRRKEIMGQINSNLIVASPTQAHSWDTAGVKTISVDKDLVNSLPDTSGPPKTSMTPEDLLYVIFTSGSTGKPKGCLIEHKAFLSGAVQHAAKSNLTSTSRVMQLASYSFDVSMLEILTSLISGATVCTPGEASLSKGLASVINSYGINWTFLTPSMVKLLSPDEVPGLKTLSLGGEPLHKGDIETWAPCLQLINGYGPTECSVAAAGDANVQPDADPANIGRAVGGLCWIVHANDHNKLVSIGAVGELLISGPILARGYLNDPSKTSKSFIEDPPWSTEWLRTIGAKPETSMRLYKTGDLAKFNSDGTIHFLGRKDHQVKLNGLRIELGDIEHNIAQNAHVNHVAVFLPKSGPCSGKLVAVLSLRAFAAEAQPGQKIAVVSTTDHGASRDQIANVRQFLKGEVPEYMFPSVWIVIEAWPLLISAKLNRKLVMNWLISMDDSTYRRLMNLGLEDENDSILSESETTLRAIYSRILNLAPDLIPVDRPFLTLGGDSLAAMRVLAHCRKAGIRLRFEDIVKSSGDLALRIEQERANEGEDFSLPIKASPVQSMLLGPIPLGDDNIGFREAPCQVVVIKVERDITQDYFKAAIEAIVSQHAMLRARFSSSPGHWVQTTEPQTEGSFHFNVYTADSVADITCIELSARRRLRPSGPVFSADLVIMRSHQLAIMAAHSAVADTTSWNIILQDLESYLLTASLESRAKSHFRQWVGKSFGRDSASDQLPNNGSSSVNTRSSNTDVFEVVENTFIIDRIATDKLLNYEIHKALRTEPEDIIVASMLQASSEGNFATILPAIHMFDSNRTSEDSELNFSGTVGCFKVLNTVSIEAAEIDSILDILRRVKDARRISIRNETKTPGANENDERSVRSGEALDIHFEYQDPIHTGTSVGSKIRLGKSRLFDCQLRSLHSKPEGTFLIDVFARPVETGLQIRCVYNPSLQIRDKIRGWFESVEHSIHSLMDEVVRSGTQYSLADFPLLPLNYNSLEALVTDRLPAIAADMDMIDEVYPCSPMQEGLLISQSVLDSGVYQHFNIVEITPRKPEATVDAARLASAWRQVVQRHSSLRTVFIESSARNGLFDQVVLKKVDPDIVMVDYAVLEADRVFKEQGALLFASGMLPHRLTICQVSADRLLIKLDINHAIIDGSSIANIVYDLVLAYEGQLPVDQAFRFSSYIQRLQQLPAQPALQFWKAYLVNLRPCLIPPLAQLEAKCVEKLAKEAQVQFNLATDVLYKFCQEANVSPASVFQAAWALVLRLYTESDDVCFGLICSGRDVALPNIEGGVGAFLNMLVHRLVLAQDMQLSDDEGLQVLDDSSIDVKNISVNDPTEYPLTLDIWFSSGRARATLRHWVDFMTPLQAESIASTFERAVHCVLANSQMTIGELELVGEHHLAKLVEFNGHSRPRSERLIFTRFEENARAKPEAPAIHGWDGSWTYTELDNITNRLAHHLRNWGVGPEVIVPHCFQKSGWAVITIMSILKAGGAFVGLDPSHPVRRLEYLVSEVNATVVCTTADNARLFVGMRNLKHLVIVQPKLIDSLPDEYGHPHTEVKPSNAACVVFTSGTTGNPKAIVIEHSSMASNSDLMGPVLKLDSSSRVFQFASYTFDVSNQDILTTLQRGGCVCIPSEDDRLNDPGAAIERLGANWANLTSTVMSLIQPATVPSLRRIFQLGEPLSREAKNLWAEKLELYNTYGPAEAAVSVTCTAPLSVESSSSNVGTAPGCSAWVVDVTDVNKLVPLDAIGELLLEGPLLARLYLKNPAKTAAAFVENPSWAQRMYPSQNRRFYRTGDLCRFNSDGTLTILGRRDTQVKINGQRVKLDEIAHQIQHQLGTRALVSVDAIRIDKTSRSKALVAFIQFLDHRYEEADSDDILISVDEQRAAEFVILHHKLRKHLPKYMVPSLLIPIRHTPRTANGKLDRSKLDEIASSLSDDKLSSYKLRIGEGQDLKTDEEKLLQTLWSDVFSVSADKISANDDFFRLGGDSVTAMNLVSAARAKGVSITVRDIFTSPLLSEMALKLRKCEENQRNEPFDLLQTSSETLKGIKDEVASQCGVPSEQVVDLYPCSPLQEGFMALSARQNGVYKAQRAFRITDKDFDWSRFKQAWAIVVKSEPILRTRIVHVNTIDRPLQAVLEEDGDVEWLEKDNLGAYLKEDREHIVSYGSVLWKNAIIQDGTSCYFVWTAHHAIYDAWSTGILFDQISHAYRTGTVSTKATDFKRMIRHLSSLKDKDEKAFWLSHFPEDTGVPTCFPITPSAAQQNYWPDQSFRLTSGVVRFPGPQTISVATILRAVWALTISHYTDSNDVVFAETLSGRNAPISGVSDMNGPAITTVPVRIRINRANGTSIKQYLEAVQAQSIAMIPFEHTGLQNIKRFGANAKSVIDSLTNLFLIQPSSLSSSSGTGIDGLETVINKFEDYDSFALVIKCILDEDRSLILEAQYDKAVIQAEQIQRILKHYDFMIQHIVNASCIPCDTPVPPADTLDSIPTIDPDDFRNVKEWNKSLPRTIKACAHELIAQRVAEPELLQI